MLFYCDYTHTKALTEMEEWVYVLPSSKVMRWFYTYKFSCFLTTTWSYYTHWSEETRRRATHNTVWYTIERHQQQPPFHACASIATGKLFCGDVIWWVSERRWEILCKQVCQAVSNILFDILSLSLSLPAPRMKMDKWK